jgi:hypothetical protein
MVLAQRHGISCKQDKHSGDRLRLYPVNAASSARVDSGLHSSPPAHKSLISNFAFNLAGTMSLLFEPSASSFLFELEANDEPFFAMDVSDLLADEESWTATDTALLDAVPVTFEPASPSLKRLRPRGGTVGGEQEPKPKRVRKSSAGRPRLRNKGKIELLRREIQSLEAELETMQHPSPGPESCHTDELWKIIAMKQSQEREHAEEENRALKRLLSAQCTLTSSLSGVMSECRELLGPDPSLSI